jgi:hypothetical protein
MGAITCTTAINAAIAVIQCEDKIFAPDMFFFCSLNKQGPGMYVIDFQKKYK